MTGPDPLELLTVVEVAGLLKRPRSFVLTLIREGKLPAVPTGSPGVRSPDKTASSPPILPAALAGLWDGVRRCRGEKRPTK